MEMTAQGKATLTATLARKRRTKMLVEAALRLVVYALLSVGAVLFTAPWAWMISASFQPLGDIFNWPPTWIPEHFTVNNYTEFLKSQAEMLKEELDAISQRITELEKEE